MTHFFVSADSGFDDSVIFFIWFLPRLSDISRICIAYLFLFWTQTGNYQTNRRFHLKLEIADFINRCLTSYKGHEQPLAKLVSKHTHRINTAVQSKHRYVQKHLTSKLQCVVFYFSFLSFVIMLCLNFKAGEIYLIMNFIPVLFLEMQKIYSTDDDAGSQRFNHF